MRNNLKKVISAVAVAGALATAPAHAFLQNWYLAFDGVNRTQVNSFLDIVGPSVVTTSVPVAGNFSFTETGAINVLQHDGGIAFAQVTTNQIAALFNLSGVGNLGGSVAYLGGLIDIYATPSSGITTFGTSGGTYGVNGAGSVLIASFGPITGGGFIDPLGIPNGIQTISARAISMLPGWFFAPDNVTDLSTFVGDPNGPLFGFATTNASFVSQATTQVSNELNGGVAVTNCLPGQTAPIPNVAPNCTDTSGVGNFMISNNGQYRLILPEPGSLALLGIALLGFGVARRRKV